MNITYDKGSKKYLLDSTMYTKENFISYIESDMLETALSKKSVSLEIQGLEMDFNKGGKNVIITGSPGTGKSYETNTFYSKNSIRCVFHNEYTNSDFIGTYKPIPNNESIIYSFIPGPFTKAVLNSFNKPDEMHNLIIEEINRADASAVFGEVFQLLDRNESGTSEYSINISDEMKNYLVKNLESDNQELINLIKDNSKIIIPSNLNIIATMNTSDQGVFTLDTAFKRRWIFVFKDIDFKKCNYKDTLLKISGHDITWENFATTINSYMMQNELPEDRQIGQFFLRENELNNEDIFVSKLLYYIWTDIAKYDKNSYFKNVTTFSELSKNFKEGIEIFSDSLLTRLSIYFK